MARPKSGRIGILSRKRALYSTSRIVEAAHKAGVRSIVMDTLRCDLIVAPRPRMRYRGAEERGLTVGLPRIGASITGYGLKVVSHLEAMGVPVLNGAPAI